MMMERIYLADSYAKEFEATITSVKENCVTLNKTAFYPGGGGVPNDEGTFIHDNKEHSVLVTKYIEGDIYHCLKETPPSVGALIKGILDWDKRYIYMRFHTALHVISAIAHNKYQANVTGNQIYLERARLDLNLENASREAVEEIVAESNKTITEEKAIIIRTISKEEALRIPDLMRTKTGRALLEKLDKVRVVEIQGLDAQADAGTHVANTSEIVGIKILKTESKGRRNRRLEIVLEQ